MFRVFRYIEVSECLDIYRFCVIHIFYDTVAVTEIFFFTPTGPCFGCFRQKFWLFGLRCGRCNYCVARFTVSVTGFTLVTRTDRNAQRSAAKRV